MAQISYGTITITDTTDIERIYPVYCKGGETTAPTLQQPLSNWSEIVSQAGGDGDYIWQRIVTKKQDVAVTVDDYSDAVRLTGDDGAALTIVQTQYAQTQNENDTPSYGNSMPSSIHEGWWLWVKTTYSDSNSVITKIKQGQKGDTGISITGTKEIYFLKRTTDNIPTAPADGVTTTSTSTAGGIWTTVVPNYSEGGIYYTSIQTTYSSGTSPKSSTAVVNQGLTDANVKALAAYNTSTARDTEINALQAQAKYFWWDNEGAHVASGESDGSIDYETPTSLKFNALMAPGSFKLRYNNKNFAQLTTGSLTFFRPAYINGQYEQGKAAMRLDGNALTFYKPLAYNSANELTAAATLDANGLVLSAGGIIAGIPNQNKFVYLSTEDYPLRQYTKTQDSAIEDGKDYYILDNDIFILVEDPISAELASYYEVSVDGISVSGYVPTAVYNDPAWRMIIGTNFGVDNCGTLYATNANISGVLNITDGNVYTKEDTINNINNIVDNIENQTIYAYSNNSDGSDYSYTNNILKYRGILVVNSQTDGEIIIPSEKVYEKTSDSQIDETKNYYRLINDEFIAVTTSDQSQINNYYELIEGQYKKTSDMLIDETKTYYELINNKFIIVDNPVQAEIIDYYELSIDEQPNKFNWEINPIYAEQNASNYMVNISGGVRIGVSNSNAYLTLNASLMQFWLNKKSMAHFGYDSIYESYGVTVENVMITGAGNALRLDNGLNGTYQGQFILETRSNGHLSLKPGLRRGEEEEEI